jgi:uroporphyrin-III C-methyltransferase/precorrin-2 dehydrogenase/sirohydrochlorin ferrochelatase
LNQLYPIFFKLAGKPVLLVGGGPVALRRAQRLLAAGAHLTVVSPSLVPALRALSDEGKIRWLDRAFAAGDLDGASFVFCQTGDIDLARRAREEAARRGIPFSAGDDESLSDFHVPAVAARGDVQVAVSTGGLSPAGAARIRDAISAWLAANAASLDEAVAPGRTARRVRPGKVYIVGAGPGDPGLLTVRALAILAAADVVYHDRLVSDEVLSAVPARAEKVYVGKEVGCATRANVVGLLAASARAGKVAVRLKGGDPMVFGRGGEEILGLRQEGIDFEVVPGVSALSAVPAAAGIPVTYRGIASEIIVRSGHSFPSAGGFGGFPAPGERRPATYVYFMAATRLAEVAGELLSEGVSPSTPVAVIQRGTLPAQRVLHTTVGGLGGAAAREAVETPALVVAGEVVKFLDLAAFLPLLEEQLMDHETHS